jgi:hypothetical protein
MCLDMYVPYGQLLCICTCIIYDGLIGLELEYKSAIQQISRELCSYTVKHHYIASIILIKMLLSSTHSVLLSQF